MPNKKVKIIDLSLPIENFASEPWPPSITYWDHKEGARRLGMQQNVGADEFPDGMGLASEKVEAITHAGTHLDAPWHFGPISEGKKAKTIDEVPLEWCYGDGVILDMRHKKPGEFITVDDVKNALKKIGYKIKPGDIVLIMTGADKKWGKIDYLEAHPGMSKEATLWLIELGVKIIGTDAWSFDRPFKNMFDDYKKTKDNKYLLPAHFAGREKEYCHLEKLTNLDKISKPYGFKVICFPVKLAKASAGWARVVAILEE